MALPESKLISELVMAKRNNSKPRLIRGFFADVEFLPTPPDEIDSGYVFFRRRFITDYNISSKDTIIDIFSRPVRINVDFLPLDFWRN